VVPGNIHPPSPTEGVGNSRGVGGSHAQEITERERWGGGGGRGLRDNIFTFFLDGSIILIIMSN